MDDEFVLLTDRDKQLLIRDRLYALETELYRREVARMSGDPAGAASGPGNEDEMRKAHAKLTAEYKRLSEVTTS